MVATWVSENDQTHARSNPEQFPSDLAEQFIGETYKSSQDVLKGMSTYFPPSERIAQSPVRQPGNDC